jgi:hypothetical protein
MRRSTAREHAERRIATALEGTKMLLVPERLRGEMRKVDGAPGTYALVYEEWFPSSLPDSVVEHSVRALEQLVGHSVVWDRYRSRQGLRLKIELVDKRSVVAGQLIGEAMAQVMAAEGVERSRKVLHELVDVFADRVARLVAAGEKRRSEILP